MALRWTGRVREMQKVINKSPIIDDKVLFKKYAEEICSVHVEKGKYNFKIAEIVSKGFVEWQGANSENNTFKYYSECLLRQNVLRSKRETLEMICSVTECFPDLFVKPENRKLSFDGYREIASRKLSKEDQVAVRKRAESEELKGQAIRKLIKEEYASNLQKSGKRKSFKKDIIYRNEEQFLQEIKSCLQSSDWPSVSTTLTLKEARKKRT